MITTATTQQQPAFSCFSKKKWKKNKKWLLLLLSHIYIPTGNHVNFTVLTLVELYQWQETDRGRSWWRDGRMERRKSEGSEWKRSWKVCWKETCRRRNGKCFFPFQLSHLEEVHASILWVLEDFTFSLLSRFGILMWTGMDWCVFEGHWMFVFRLVGWTRERKSKKERNRAWEEL